MIPIFRRGGDHGDGDAILASHILAKFLKRLRAMPRPHLLDLGRLSGSNIEFFAQARCKVQVEDLVGAADASAPPPGTPPADDAAASLERASAPAIDGTDAGHMPARAETARGRAPDPPAGLAAEIVAAGSLVSTRVAEGATALGGARLLPGAALRAGARPSRRIVLPPRTFPRGRTAPTAQAATARPVDASPAAALPLTFGFGDEAFDAIVAWDVFNYYDAAGMRAVAAEARRVLKPGGLLLAYFHARSAAGPESPRRYRILDEKRVACDVPRGAALPRHVYQNRDIEKMFAGLSIVELYFLKNAMREILLEKKTSRTGGSTPLVRPAVPRARFSIE